MFVLAAGAACAQENWRIQPQPAGAPITSIAMWGDSGIAMGTYSWITGDDGQSWKANLGVYLYSSALEPDGRAWVSDYVPGTNGLLYTSNFGNTWAHCPFPYPAGTHMWRVIGTDPGTRMAFVRDDARLNLGIFASSDPNDSIWREVVYTGLPTDLQANEIIFNPKTKSLVLSFLDQTNTTVSLYRSTDMGITWEPMTLVGVPAEAVPTTSGVLWATRSGIEFLDTRTQVGNEAQWSSYRSSDDGATWAPTSSGLPAFMCLNYTAQRPTGEIYATAARIAPGNNDIWFGMVYKSTDEGITWTELPNAGLPPGFAVNISVTPRGTLIATGNPGSGGGAFRSTDDGATWTPSVKGMYQAFTMSVAIDSAGRKFVMAPSQGLFRYQRSDGWTRLTNGIPAWGWKNICVGKNNVVFVSDTSGGIYRSTDQGDSWTAITSGLANLHNYEIQVSRAGTVLLCTFSGVYRSTNDGDSWNVAPRTIPPGIIVHYLGVRKDGFLIATTGVGPYVSSDDGNTWTLKTGGLVVPSCSGVGFCKDGTILLGNGSTIVRSSDNGEHWLPSATGVVPRDNGGNNIFTQFACRANGRIVAARYDTVFMYVSTDNGKTWADDRKGQMSTFQNLYIPNLQSAPDDSLYATSTLGFWAAGGTPASVGEMMGTPAGVTLTVSGPNPSDDNTRVAFSLAQTDDVRLALLDDLGRTVWENAPATALPGPHEVGIPTSGLSSGTYHCTLYAKHGVYSATIIVKH